MQAESEGAAKRHRLGSLEHRERTGIPGWLVLTVVAVVPFVIVRGRLNGVDDPDAFWHILSGQLVWQTHSVVGPDPLGHFSSYEWIQIDWLSDLWMAGLYAAGGLAAVAWAYTALTVMVFVVLYATCRQRAGIVVSAIVAVAGWVGTSASLAFRPQTVSFVLLGVTIYAWRRSLLDRQPRWWLIPLGWIWACSHGLWFLGPVVGFAVIAGDWLDGNHDKNQFGRLVMVPLGALVAAMLTPVGPRLLILPFTVNSYADLVSEYAPPDIHDPFVAATVALLVVTVVGWARSARTASWGDVLMWVMALALAVLYARTVAIGAILVAPLAADQLQRLLRGRDAVSARTERAVVAGSVAASLALGALLAPHVAGQPRRVPTSLDTALRQLAPETVVLNDDGLGGWLLLDYPKLRPIADTRTYLFSFDYLSAYEDTRMLLGNWRGFLSRTGARAALLKDGEALTRALQNDPEWRVKARGDGYVLLVRP